MRATIAILLLIGLAQCMAHPFAQERRLDEYPGVPRVTEKPTDGAVTDAPSVNSLTTDEFLLRSLHYLARDVSTEELRALMISDPDLNAPLNAFRWTSRDYANLSKSIERLIYYQYRMIEEAEYKTKKELDREHSRAEY